MLIKNSIICQNCFQQITSAHQHDYVTCKCGGCSVDGGLSYQKLSGKFFDASIKSTDPHDKIRMNLEWGTRGKNGNETLRYVKICDLETSHIVKILETQRVTEEIKKIFKDELSFRMQNL